MCGIIDLTFGFGNFQNLKIGGGAHYYWTAATLGYSIKDTLGADDQVSGSICPKGWTLPANDGDKSWQNLVATTYGIETGNNNLVGVAKMPYAPLNLLRTGAYYWSYGYVFGLLTDGNWWSATAGSATGAYYLYTSASGDVHPQFNRPRSYGFAIRCVAR